MVTTEKKLKNENNQKGAGKPAPVHRDLFHIFYKSEHLVGTFVVFGIFVILRAVALVFERIAVVFAEEFDNVKAEFVDVEVDIPLLEIRRAGLPNYGIGVKALYLPPCGGADALAVNVRRHEQDIKLVMLNIQDQPAGDFACLQIPMSYDVGIELPLVSKSIVDRAHRRNIAVQYWTINDADDMRTLIKMGVDCIMTDDPLLLSQVLEEFK